MRPVNRGESPLSQDNNAIAFNHYRDALDYMVERIGSYCSYCEIYLPMALAIEHIQPKSLHPDLEVEWLNFLLSCPSCNSRKGQCNINAENIHEYFWPQSDNTFKAFIYEIDRAPQISPTLNAEQQQIAENTLRLTGLHQEPTCRLFTKDKRWISRNTAWTIAERNKTMLNHQPTEETKQLIIENAISRGFWSVWMTVFKDDIDMRKRLITAFKGTSTECFDENTLPLQRVGGKI